MHFLAIYVGTVAMNTFCVVVLLALISSCQCKRLKCDQVCPICDWNFDETFADVIINLIKSNGPGDGVCLYGHKWTQTVSYLGSNYNICCCVDIPPFETCAATDPRVCTPGLSSLAGELIGDFWIRTGETLKDSAPEDGCCPAGSFKYIYSKGSTGQAKDICTCIPG